MSEEIDEIISTIKKNLPSQIMEEDVAIDNRQAHMTLPITNMYFKQMRLVGGAWATRLVAQRKTQLLQWMVQQYLVPMFKIF